MDIAAVTFIVVFLYKNLLWAISVTALVGVVHIYYFIFIRKDKEKQQAAEDLDILLIKIQRDIAKLKGVDWRYVTPDFEKDLEDAKRIYKAMRQGVPAESLERD